MDTLQILCALRDVKSFAGVFPSDLLPHSIPHDCTIIINADPHTKEGSHWLAVRFMPKSSSAYYFDSYGLPPTLVPDIYDCIRRNSTVCDYNKRRMQGWTSDVCGQYCCLFALYADRGYNPQHFVGLWGEEKGSADIHIGRTFLAEFGPLLRRGGRSCGQCCRARL